MRFILFFIAGFLLGSCSNKKDIYTTPTFSKNNNLQAVVEIPAGTNKKIEYTSTTPLNTEYQIILSDIISLIS